MKIVSAMRPRATERDTERRARPRTDGGRSREGATSVLCAPRAQEIPLAPERVDPWPSSRSFHFRLLSTSIHLVPLHVLKEGIDVGARVRSVVHRIRVLVHVHDEER